MNLRQPLILLGRKLERTWTAIQLTKQPWSIDKGWYIAHFTISGTLNHVPEIIMISDSEEKYRILEGAHVGKNRMMFYLLEGQVIAYDKQIEFETLHKITYLEARSRVILVCVRVLRDFFSFAMLGRLFAIQFRNDFDLSTDLLQFYNNKNYLYDSDKLHKNLMFHPLIRRFYQWRYRHVKLGILVSDDTQKEALLKQVIAPDWVFTPQQWQSSEVGATADYIIALQVSDSLHPVTVYKVKQAILKSKRRPNILYTDHDYIGEVRVEPVFKPTPSLPYYECSDYMSMAVALRLDKLIALRSFDITMLLKDGPRYQLVLSLFEQAPNDVMSIDEVLFRSTRVQHGATPGLSAEQTPWPTISKIADKSYNRLIANKEAMQMPSVDLIIPTRDGLEVLKPCIESLLSITSYPNFTIAIVDNGSEKPETLAYFKELEQISKINIVSYPGEFNYSAINNFAVQCSKAEYVALVNNDIEAIHADWLTQMMAWVQLPQVGIVGAKLLYGNGDIQHAGVTIGMGNAAGHIHRLEKGDSVGYQHRCVATQNMMAVTAACLVTSKNIYDDMGGLNEIDFKVAYNDIDFCLRVEQAGYDIIWTPEARLYHYESVSRGDDMSDEHISRYFKELACLQKRWKTKGFTDKYYSKHLRITDEGVYPCFSHTNKEQLHYLGK